MSRSDPYQKASSIRPPERRKVIEPYDFRQPKLFSKEIMSTLRSIHDVLARNLNRTFTSALRHKAEVYFHKIDQLSTSDFISGLESPSVIYMLSVKELGGELIVVLPNEFCLYLVERQSGGQEEDFTERRTLTTIEEKIVDRIMKGVNREIISAWEPYMDFSIHSTTYESKPENIHVAALDPTILASLIIEVGKHRVEIKFSYPYGLLKEAMQDSMLSKDSKLVRLSNQELESYQRTLHKALVQVQPLLGTTRLTVEEILSLKEGDTIPLNQKPDEPLEVRVNGMKKMTAYPGKVRGRRAVKIFELVEEINEEEVL